MYGVFGFSEAIHGQKHELYMQKLQCSKFYLVLITMEFITVSVQNYSSYCANLLLPLYIRMYQNKLTVHYLKSSCS